MAAIPCNQIEQESLRLQNIFKSCSTLKASDLDALTNLAYSASLCGEGGLGVIEQNNIILSRLTVVDDETTPTTSASVAINALTTFTVDEKEILEFKHFKTTVLDDFRTILEVTNYLFKPGKGTYGLLGTQITDNDLLLIERREIELGTPTDTTTTPIVYNLYTGDLGGSTTSTPATILNVKIPVINITGTRDVYFQVFDNTSGEGTSKLYRFVGVTGTYGSGGSQLATGGDFILVQEFGNSSVEVIEQKIKIRELMVSSIIKEGTSITNIAEAVADSFSSNLSCSEFELLIFVSQKQIDYSATDSTTQTLVTEKWLWKKGKTSNIPSVCALTDFVKIEEKVSTVLIPTAPGQNDTQVIVFQDTDLDTPEVSLNAYTTPVVVNNNDLYIKLVSIYADRYEPEYKIYKFIGGDGTYGDGGTTTVSGDFTPYQVYSESTEASGIITASDVLFTTDITSTNVQDAIEEVMAAVNAISITSPFNEVGTGDPLLDISTDGTRTGKLGFNKAVPTELVDIVGTQSGSTGSLKLDYTWTGGEISRVQLGGQNILSELSVPSDTVKGNVLDYFGVGTFSTRRAYVGAGDFSSVIPSLGTISTTIGVTNLLGTDYANTSVFSLTGDTFAVANRIQNSDSDLATSTIRQYGYVVGTSLEPILENIVSNSETDTSSLKITPHIVELTNLTKLASYGSGTFVTGYTHTDNLAKTGTAASVIGATQYLLGIDSSGIVNEVALTSFLTDEALTFSGTRAGSDLELILGDYDNSGNSTKITLDDSDNTITIDGNTTINPVGSTVDAISIGLSSTQTALSVISTGTNTSIKLDQSGTTSGNALSITSQSNSEASINITHTGTANAIQVDSGTVLFSDAVTLGDILVLTATAKPGSPVAGTIIRDSGDSNNIKIYDGTNWYLFDLTLEV